MVFHSATKFLFGGHSDLLAGVLATKDINVKSQLLQDRTDSVSNLSNLESFLLIRSLRTYGLRIMKQSENAEKLINCLVVHKKNILN